METEEQKNPRETAYKLAAHFLHADAYKVLAAIIICSLPRAFTTLSTGIYSSDFWVMLLTRVLELYCLYHLCVPHVNKFRNTPTEPKTLLRLVSFGILYWLIVRAFEIAANSIPEPKAATTIALILIVPAVAFGLIYFFYFFPFCAGIRDYKLAISETRWFTKKDFYSPLRALITPLALYFLIKNIAFIGSPDGREFYTTILDCFITEIPFFLSIYTSMGLCLFLIEGKKWHDYGFNPYREARFETLSSQAPETLSQLLSPRKGLIILIASAFIGYANLARMQDLPPGPSITVTQKEVIEKDIYLKLSLEDFEHRFRGFQPHGFKIAGPKGTDIHGEKPPRVSFDVDDVYKTAELSLTFVTGMNIDEIQRLEDLHLWYFNIKLDKLEDFTEKTKVEAET